MVRDGATSTAEHEHDRGRVLWRPPADVRERSRIGRYLAWLAAERDLAFDGYGDLWRWSVTDLDGFWRSIWDHFALESTAPVTAALADATMPGARWFPGVELNYAAHALRAEPDGPALVGLSQVAAAGRAVDGRAARAGRPRAGPGSSRQGVGRGDRVAAYLPNIPETVVALLATASLGAIWSSCAPEFGTRSVVDRWQQIEPVVLLAVDGYRYGAKAIDRRDEVAAIRAALPSLRATVTVPYLADGEAARHESSLTWGELLAESPSEAGPGAAGGRVRARAVRPPAVRPVLVGHHRAARSRSCTGTAASRSSTTRCWRCTTTSGRATASSGSRPRAG